MPDSPIISGFYRNEIQSYCISRPMTGPNFQWFSNWGYQLVNLKLLEMQSLTDLTESEKIWECVLTNSPGDSDTQVLRAAGPREALQSSLY